MGRAKNTKQQNAKVYCETMQCWKILPAPFCPTERSPCVSCLHVELCARAVKGWAQVLPRRIAPVTLLESSQDTAANREDVSKIISTTHTQLFRGTPVHVNTAVDHDACMPISHISLSCFANKYLIAATTRAYSTWIAPDPTLVPLNSAVYHNISNKLIIAGLK